MIDYRTVTLDDAIRAVRAYNAGCYAGGIKNPDLDGQAHKLFANGLETSFEGLLRQVQFIGKDYGGAAGFRSAYSLAPAIAQDILAGRDRFAALAAVAPALAGGITPVDVITKLHVGSGKSGR